MTLLAVLVALPFLSAGPTAPLFVVAAVAAILWFGSVPLPAALARAAMYLGKQSMFLYLAHVLVIAVLAKVGVAEPVLRLLATIAVSLVAAEVMSRVMRFVLRPIELGRARPQES